MNEKVFVVSVETTRRLAIVARTAEEAEAKAEACLEEAKECSDDCDSYTDAHATPLKKPGDYSGTLPYGVGVDDKRRNWTVDDWIAKKGKLDPEE